ncbi:MAG TPA: MarR family transcriptional regulator [Pilimelia sp.]|nr:MarR family transcriptional regulator [Pilimelia sp.]
MSVSQLRALLAIEASPGINLRRLAAGLDIILSSASRLCDRLVAAGLLEREPGRLDRREISLTLTGSGAGLLAELRVERRRMLAEALAGMSETGRAALLNGLREFTAVAEPVESHAVARSA